jgi:superfamily II DNA/RNA helicase
MEKFYGQNEQKELSEIEFTRHDINGQVYNVNHLSLELITNFGDMEPQYSDEYGPHIVATTTSDPENPHIIPLSRKALSSMLISGSKDMTKEQFETKFVEEKKKTHEFIVKKTYAKGFESPSPVQSISMIPLMLGRDCLVQSKSGTGKTHAFIAGLGYNFDINDPELQFIFGTSSHEVAIQIYEQLRFLLPDKANIVLCIGQRKESSGVSGGGFKNTISTSSLNTKPKTISQEMKEAQSAQIVVCTMGKFYNYLCDRKWLNTKYLKAMCIDEFDQIVTAGSSRSSTVMSTKEQMDRIVKFLPKDVQLAFFSATVSPEALETAYSYFRSNDPFISLLDPDNYTLEGIKQYYMVVRNYKDKELALIHLLQHCRITQGIVFTNRKETAEKLQRLLRDQNVPMDSEVFHSGLSSVGREKIIKEFKYNKIKLLISTDVIARGFDMQSINIVICFDMPDDPRTYVHRVGRSGRFGRKGVSISLIIRNEQDYDEIKKVNAINEFSKVSKMIELPDKVDDLL